MKTGIFGGTFDPPHRGHLRVALDVRRIASLDEVIFIPSAISPHKQTRLLSPPEDRLAMVRLATAGIPGVSVSDIEVRRGGVSYTIDTIRAIHGDRPDDELYLLLGLDNIEDFWSWKEPQAILELASLVIMTRPGVSRPSLGAFAGKRVTLAEVTPDEAASSGIRSMIARGMWPGEMLVPAVFDYIQSHGLYRGK
jgi:nicotinate-nucleotide adenylyltransferase